jgi:hypothetical protein
VKEPYYVNSTTFSSGNSQLTIDRKDSEFLRVKKVCQPVEAMLHRIAILISPNSGRA